MSRSAESYNSKRSRSRSRTSRNRTTEILPAGSAFAPAAEPTSSSQYCSLRPSSNPSRWANARASGSSLRTVDSSRRAPRPTMCAAAVSKRRVPRPRRRKAGITPDQIPAIPSVWSAQLLARLLGLAEPVEAHALEDLRRLRELDVLVGDDLDVVAPGVANPIPADVGSRFPGGPERPVPFVDDQPEVAMVVGRLLATFGERDELIADVDERHAPGSPPQRELEDPAVELERLLDVPDLSATWLIPTGF